MEILAIEDSDPNLNLVHRSNANASSQFDEKDPLKISFKDIQDLTFSKEELQDKVITWANSNKFNLVQKHGKRSFKKLEKIKFFCQVKECNYRIIFKNNLGDTPYKLCQKLSTKYIKHTNSICYLKLRYLRS